jgi:AraC-like DNA-binding protein
LLQNDFSETNQPSTAPTAAGKSEASARLAPGRISLDENLTLGEYVTPEQLAQHLGKSTRTLARWHARRIGPPRCSVGKLVLYRVAAVRTWLAERESLPVALSNLQAGARRK